MDTDAKTYQHDFLQLAIDVGALRFGEFTLKSGRISPYFFNAGAFDHGAALARLGNLYARAIVDTVSGEFMLFGPAYKGIPLAAATAVALAARFVTDVGYAFNRKEAKDHGEGGILVGAPLAGQVVIVDDVITAGISIDESVGAIRAAGAAPIAVIIALDRQERGLEDERSAVAALAQRHGLQIRALAGLDTLMRFLTERAGFAAELEAVRAYHRRYGVSAVGDG